MPGRTLRCYLIGSRFNLATDRRAPKRLPTMQDQLAELSLQPCSFSVESRAGRQHKNTGKETPHEKHLPTLLRRGGDGFHRNSLAAVYKREVCDGGARSWLQDHPPFNQDTNPVGVIDKRSKEAAKKGYLAGSQLTQGPNTSLGRPSSPQSLTL